MKQDETLKEFKVRVKNKFDGIIKVKNENDIKLHLETNYC